MALTVECYAGAAPAGWDETIGELGSGIFHSSAWADFQRALSPSEPYFLLARDGRDRPVGATLSLFQRSRNPLAALVLRGLSLPAHPVVEPDAAEVSDTLMARCIRLGKNLGCARITLDSVGSHRSAFRPSSLGFRESRRTEFVVDLTPGLDTVWRSVDKKQRERIRRLERAGVDVSVAGDRAALDALQSLRRSTWRKRVERGQGYAVEWDAAYDAALQSCILDRGLARIFLARVDGEPAAGILFTCFGRRAYSVFSGSSDAGYRLGAQSLLYWRAVEWFVKERFLELNRGGVAGDAGRPDHPLHGIYQFKLRLGTRPVECRSGVRILSRWRASVIEMRIRLRARSAEPEPGG